MGGRREGQTLVPTERRKKGRKGLQRERREQKKERRVCGRMCVEQKTSSPDKDRKLRSLALALASVAVTVFEPASASIGL